MTHVPCPPVKITPAVFQHRSSIISHAANENNGACGEETRQTKRGKKPSETEIPAGLLYIYTSSFPFPSDTEVDRLPTRSHVKIFKEHTASEKFSWLFSSNPTWQSSRALCRHFLGLTQKTPPPQNKDASLHRPTTCGWVNGHSFVIPYYQRKAARLLCRHPNCDCQTLYWIMCREEECMSLLSLEDERAGNAKVAVLWGPVYRGRMKTCIVCMIHVPHCISVQQGLRGGRLAWNAGGEGQGICILLFT